MAKLPKHISRSGPPTADPINKASAIGISYREPQNIEKKLSPIEEIQCKFKALENSVITLCKTKEKSPRLLAPVEVYEIAQAIKKENKKSTLSKDQIDHLIKKEVRRKNEIKAKRIQHAKNKNISKECELTLSAIKKELNKNKSSEALKLIAIDHIKKISKSSSEHISIANYVESIREIINPPNKPT